MGVRGGYVAFGLMLALGACAGEQPPPPETSAAAVPATEALALQLTTEQASGKVVFETMCWTCHGSSGHGNGPAVQATSVSRPPDFTTGDYPRLTPAQLQARFAARSHPTMTYIQSMLQPEVFQAALAYVPALGYPAEIPGSAIGGAAMYALRCVGCHGSQGRGDGPAATQLTVKPADFTQDTLIARRDFEGVFRRIKQGGGPVHGSAMPPWGVLFSDAEIWDVVAFVATFQPGSVAARPVP